MRLIIALSLILSGLPGMALAAGNQYGWCRGTGNPHGADCGVSNPSGVIPPNTPAHIPTATETMVPSKPPLPGAVLHLKRDPIPIMLPKQGPKLRPGQGQPSQPYREPLAIPNPSLPPQRVPGRIPTRIETPQEPYRVPVAIPNPSLPPQRVPGQIPLRIETPPEPYRVPVANPNPSLPPQLVPQRVPEPVAIPMPQPLQPHRVPVATPEPSLPPQRVPGQIPLPVETPQEPYRVPVAIPDPVLPPQLAPSRRPSVVPTVVPGDERPTVVVRPNVTSVDPGLVPRQPGRQLLHAPARFEDRSGTGWDCVASGHGRRRYVDDRGVTVELGSAPSLAFSETIVRDIPAWHPQEAGCLIAIKRKLRR